MLCLCSELCHTICVRDMLLAVDRQMSFIAERVSAPAVGELLAIGGTRVSVAGTCRVSPAITPLTLYGSRPYQPAKFGK